LVLDSESKLIQIDDRLISQLGLLFFLLEVALVEGLVVNRDEGGVGLGEEGLLVAHMLLLSIQCACVYGLSS
jgi:hypothetical protein